MKLLEIKRRGFCISEIPSWLKKNFIYSFHAKEWIPASENKYYSRWLYDTNKIIDELVLATDRLIELQIKDKFLIIETYQKEPNTMIDTSFILTNDIPLEFRNLDMIDWR